MELEAPTAERKKTDKHASKPELEIVRNNINDSVAKKPQPASNLTQDQPKESLSRKRELSSSPSCTEKTKELKSAQISPRRQRKKKKKKKKKKGSIIKRFFQKFRWKPNITLVPLISLVHTIKML